jgi:Family of unknown function (DUF6522)
MSLPSIEIKDGAFLIDASVIATGLDVEPSQVPNLIRSGEITSISKQGVGEDAGFHRLTVHYRNERFRLIVDGAGEVRNNAWRDPVNNCDQRVSDSTVTREKVARRNMQSAMLEERNAPKLKDAIAKGTYVTERK